MRNLLTPIVVGLASMCVTGCTISDQIHWSPDGTRAVFLSLRDERKQAFLIDEQGNILRKLGESAGGFAWSGDSKTLYFATIENVMAGAATLDERWVTSAVDEDGVKPQRRSLTVSALRDNKVTPLFSLNDKFAWHMALSPGDRWLAVIATSHANENGLDLYAYSIRSNKLFTVAADCGLGMCFRAPDRLAYISCNRPGENAQGGVGHVMEVTLDETVDKLSPMFLLDVVPGQTPWLQPLGEDLLLSAAPSSFPRMPADEPPPAYTIYRLNSQGELSTLVSDVGPFFMPSPSGDRLLVEKINDEENRQIALLDLQRNKVQMLGAKAVRGVLPMYPNWRGNNEIALASAEPATKDGDVSYFDVVLYRLTDEGRLVPLRTLSTKWEQTIKPELEGLPEVQEVKRASLKPKE